MRLDSAARMKLTFCCNVSRVRGFGSFEPAEGFISPIYANGGTPFISTTAPVNAEETRPITAGSVATVLLIDSFGDGSEILNPVIGSDAVNVVDLAVVPNTMHVKPSKSMQCVGFPIKHGEQVTVPVQATDDVIFGFRPTTRIFPNELSSGLIKIYERAQSFCANIWLSHEAPLLLIG